MIPDPNPCDLFECADVTRPVDYCERIRQCPYAWARVSREDRVRREERQVGRMERLSHQRNDDST